MDRARAAKDVIRAPLDGLAEGTIEAPRELVHYLASVRRLPMGSPFVAFDPAKGVEATATLAREGGRVLLRVGPLAPARATARRPLVLIQGMGKADKCDAVVRDATELGATTVIVALTERSVARPPRDKLPSREARWRRIAAEAARQSGRGDAPHVFACASLDDALARVPEGAGGFVLWEKATSPLGPPLFLAVDSGAPLAFVVGPEGGLSEAEVDRCRARGFAALSLGPLVLRTETVAAAVLGAVRVVSGE